MNSGVNILELESHVWSPKVWKENLSINVQKEKDEVLK